MLAVQTFNKISKLEHKLDIDESLRRKKCCVLETRMSLLNLRVLFMSRKSVNVPLTCLFP